MTNSSRAKQRWGLKSYAQVLGMTTASAADRRERIWRWGLLRPQLQAVCVVGCAVEERVRHRGVA